MLFLEVKSIMSGTNDILPGCFLEGGTCASEGRCVGTFLVLIKWFIGFENEFYK